MKLTTVHPVVLLKEHIAHDESSSSRSAELLQPELTGLPGCRDHGPMGRSSFSQLMRRGKEKREGRGEPACPDLPKERHGEEG